jgi:DNA-binding SARP family transcriptional activator
MTELRIRLFGQVSVQQGEQPLAGLSAKALELFCYLLLHRERAHTRETLAGMLWPEAPDAVSKKYLRQAIWQLHSVLASRAPERKAGEEELLNLHPGWVRLNPKAAWWLDVAVFEHAYNRCRDIPGEDLTDAQGQALEAAVDLYRGDLIEAWRQDWCIYERDRLRLTYLALLEQLMGYSEAWQRYAKGVAYGQCILRYDPARECTYRHLMRLYYLAGDRTTALRQYDHCAVAMAKHFSLQPSRETVALYHQIRADCLKATARQAMAGPLPDGEPRSDLLLGLHTRLDHVQASLATLHHEVQQERAAISRMLTAEQQTHEQTAAGRPGSRRMVREIRQRAAADGQATR